MKVKSVEKSPGRLSKGHARRAALRSPFGAGEVKGLSHAVESQRDLLLLNTHFS